jgi:hypothetical protein
MRSFVYHFSIHFSMSRLLLFSFFLLSPFAFCAAQDYGLCIQVVASAGKTAAQGNYKIAWTVGEPVVTTLSMGGRTLTQGFHQPDICQSVATKDLDLAAWEIEVFPNPTADFLNIRFSDENGSGALRASVFDVLGRAMLLQQPLDEPSGTSLNCQAWQSGVYFLRLEDAATGAAATVRFVRL